MRNRLNTFVLIAALLVGSALGIGVLAQSPGPDGAFQSLSDYVVAGDWTFQGTVTNQGNQTISGDLTVTGDILGTGDITRTGDIALTGDITGTGDQTRTGELDLTGGFTATAGIESATPGAAGGIGYAVGAGCAVTQTSSRSDGVACAGLAGAITTDTTSLAAEASADFIVTNASVEVGDAIIVSIRSGEDSGGTLIGVQDVTAGTFAIRVHNGNAASGTAETGAIIINFVVLKGVSS